MATSASTMPSATTSAWRTLNSGWPSAPRSSSANNPSWLSKISAVALGDSISSITRATEGVSNMRVMNHSLRNRGSDSAGGTCGAGVLITTSRPSPR
jgi:hypothetical protein